MELLDLVYAGDASGLTAAGVGELFGLTSLSLVGVGLFVAFFLAGFPLMTAELVSGTVEEGRASTLDLDFGLDLDREPQR